MGLFLPPTATDMAGWVRSCANAVNGLLRGFPFPASATAPNNPQRGQCYYDTATNVAKTWDGTVWRPLW